MAYKLKFAKRFLGSGKEQREQLLATHAARAAEWGRESKWLLRQLDAYQNLVQTGKRKLEALEEQQRALVSRFKEVYVSGAIESSTIYTKPMPSISLMYQHNSRSPFRHTRGKNTVFDTFTYYLSCNFPFSMTQRPRRKT